MKNFHLRITGILLLISGLAVSPLVLAQKISVSAANPASAVQGTLNLDVEISGNGFDETIDEVEFLLPCPVEPCTDTGGITVDQNSISVLARKKLKVNIDVSETAVVADFDIAVRSSSRGRGGKGTTLFKVTSNNGGGGGNACDREFEAVFRDGPTDGLVSDTLGSYVAIGGTGFRLDTNGGAKLERKNDTRFVFIDFSAAGVCEGGNFAPAGFCQALKGVDLRFEHQAQDPDMCPLQPGQSMPMSIRVSFWADPGNTLINDAQNGNGATALSLGYGCTHPNLDPSDAAYPGLVTRTGEYTWTIEGSKACLFTWGGSKLVDEGGNTVYLDMPFKITIVDVNAP